MPAAPQCASECGGYSPACSSKGNLAIDDHLVTRAGRIVGCFNRSHAPLRVMRTPAGSGRQARPPSGTTSRAICAVREHPRNHVGRKHAYGLIEIDLPNLFISYDTVTEVMLQASRPEQRHRAGYPLRGHWIGRPYAAGARKGGSRMTQNRSSRTIRVISGMTPCGSRRRSYLRFERSAFVSAAAERRPCVPNRRLWQTPISLPRIRLRPSDTTMATPISTDTRPASSGDRPRDAASGS